MRYMQDKERRKMVRVISCHHFQSQDVFSVASEPVALCTAKDQLLIATLQHCIEVWDLKQAGQLLHSFPTVDQAKQMLYCSKGDYVATLEVRASRQAVMSFVRVYLNWQVDMKGQPMRARIAGRVTPSSQSGVGLFEMVELPLKKQAFCMAVCYETGNIAIGLGDVVSIFHFCTKTHDLSRRPFYDLEHLLDITLSLSAHHLALCEDVLACLSPNELHVLQIRILPKDFDESHHELLSNASSVSSSFDETHISEYFDAEKFIIQDENFVVWDFNAASSTGTNQSLNHLKWKENIEKKVHPDSWPLVINLPGLTDSHKLSLQQEEVRELLGPTEAFNVKTELVGMKDHAVTLTTLLYRHFQLDQEISSGLHSLHLVPVYLAGRTRYESHDEKSRSVFSVKSHNRCGLSCFFSSPQQGFLYDITNKTRLFAMYPYTSSARAVSLEMNLLHAVTEAGLETYTLRSVHNVLQHMQSNQPNIKLPSFPDDPVCLVGLQAFLNVEQIVLSENRLILLSAIADELSSSQDSDSGNWTIYSLMRSTPVEFYSDLLEVANAHREKSPSTYIHLLFEAHCILKGELLTQSCPDPTVVELFSESCCLMGDFYLMSENSTENHLAVSFYQMSQCSIEKIVNRVLNLWAQVHPMPLPVKGLIDYLNNYLLNGKSKTDVSQTMADTILDLYADNEPAKLAQVITKGLNNYNQDKALMLLKKRIITKKSCPEDVISLTWLYVELGQMDQVSTLLSSLPKERLLESLIQHHELWVKHRQFSVFAQTIRQWRPDIFVETTLQLVFNLSFSVNDILLIFQDTSPDNPPHKIHHFKEFLEALLTSNQDNVWNSDAPVCLAKIYLLRLLEGPKERQSQSLLRALNLFGVRLAWLNMLPPFDGRSMRDPCLVKQGNRCSDKNGYCPCWECNEELLRLQSLMCHELCPPSVNELVLKEVLTNSDKIIGSLSLHILSVPPNEVVSLLADSYPTVLIHYSKDIFGDSLEKWQLVRDTLISKLKKTTPAMPLCAVLNQAMQMLLSHLSEIFPPSTFLTLLPPGDPSTYFPFVQRCCHKHQANVLKEKIIAKGIELKAIV